MGELAALGAAGGAGGVDRAWPGRRRARPVRRSSTAVVRHVGAARDELARPRPARRAVGARSATRLAARRASPRTCSTSAACLADSTTTATAPESDRIQLTCSADGGLVDRHGDRAGGEDRVVDQRPLVAGAREQRDPVARLRRPAAIRPRATAVTSAANAPAVTSTHCRRRRGGGRRRAGLVARGVGEHRVDEVLVVGDAHGGGDAVLTHVGSTYRPGNTCGRDDTNRACRRSTWSTRRSSPCPRGVLAAEFATPARWRALWPDLDLEVMTDRGDEGLRWTVTGALVGTMEVWLEPVLDGTLLHYFLRADPPGPRARRGGRAAEAQRRQRGGEGDRARLQGPPGGGPGGGGAARPVASSIMRVHVVSDVHGNAEALARAGRRRRRAGRARRPDRLRRLPRPRPRASSAAVFGPEVSAALRAAARRGRARRAGARSSATLWSRFADAAAVVEEAVREQYDGLFAAMTAPTYAIPGNVDVAALWPEFARPGVCLPDGAGRRDRRAAVRVRRRRAAAAGRGAAPRRRVDARTCARPRSYAAAVARLGAVDVLCSHAPPAVPELAYDVVSRRSEAPSPALLDADPPRPARGPRCSGTSTSRSRRGCGSGRTECVNVGHFRADGQRPTCCAGEPPTG